MSDPVTTAEVEDVLSSIRRLVSEDRRPQLRGKSEKPVEDKLVLTPSLRVSNDAPLIGAYKKQQRNVPPTEWDETIDVASDLRGSDHLIAPSEEPVETNQPTAAVDISDDRFHEKYAFYFEDTAENVEDFDLTADNIPDTTSVDRPSAADTAPVEKAGAVSGSAIRTVGNRNDILSLGASELVEDVPLMSARLSAKIAALGNAISRIPENWEPDEPGEGDYSGSDAPAMAWEDDVELDNTGAPLNAADRSPSDEAIEAELAAANEPSHLEEEDTFDNDDQDASPSSGFSGEEYFDEEMLRDLVSDIVRSELQGALGERITRNVRKFVRREIHFALNAQELE